MKRMNCYFLLLAASLCVLPLHAQKGKHSINSPFHSKNVILLL